MARPDISAYVIGLFVCVIQLTGETQNYDPLNNPQSRQKRFTFPGWSQDTSKTGITEEERVALILRHNELRRQPSPTATDMIFLVWDDHLASVAQAYSTGCDFQHNYANNYGENLSVQQTYYNVTKMVDGWYSEGNSYDYSTHGCTTSTCAHYHQVVLAESRFIGCGMTFCPSMSTVTMSNGYYLVCNYNPAVNKGSSRPYVSGVVCSNCPAEYPTCENSLCRANPICGGLTCADTSRYRPDLCDCDCDGQDIATCGEVTPGTPSEEDNSSATSGTPGEEENNTSLNSTGPTNGGNPGQTSVFRLTYSESRMICVVLTSLLTCFLHF